MPADKLLILNHEQIASKTVRIAFQVYEDNFGEDELILAGIADRGYRFAQRLQEEIQRISSIKVDLIKINLEKDSSTLRATTDKDISIAKNRAVILIDDVLNSGRTLAYGLGVFFDVPLKKVRTAVLVDRSHHKFPIVSDFSGMKLSTVLNERVSVVLHDDPLRRAEDAAYLI